VKSSDMAIKAVRALIQYRKNSSFETSEVGGGDRHDRAVCYDTKQDGLTSFGIRSRFKGGCWCVPLDANWMFRRR